MAEFSYDWTSNGSGSGDQVASYTQVNLTDIHHVIAACSAKEGIASGYLNSLAGSVTGANTVQIATGGALVDGHPYINTAAVDVTIPSAVGGGNTRIDRIVLRCSWAAYTVRITRIAGVDAASPSAPAITQTAGTTYDIMLYQALVDTSGNVTITDERVIANNLYVRQGGDATDWSVDGTTNYRPVKVIMQTGTCLTTNNPAARVTVTFPVAFADKPVVFLSNLDGSYHLFTDTLAAASTQVAAKDSAGSDVAAHVCWLAIGSIA